MATRNPEVEEKYKNQTTQTVVNNASLPADHGVYPSKGADWPGCKFSIIFPSRDRQDLLLKMLQSLTHNTTHLDQIEVLIAVDHDDKKTFKFLCDLSLPFVKIYQVMRSLNFSRDYYNFLAKESKGRWIITANDDCVMETPHWDDLAYDVLKDKPGVIYGWIEDRLGGFRANGHGNYCCFPLQGRAGFEALGYIFPTRVPTWGADIWAKNLYDQIGSCVKLPITLRHDCHHNKTREQDHISKRIAHNQVPFDMRPTYEEINKLIEAMKKEQVKV